jgi:hypothetical protein
VVTLFLVRGAGAHIAQDALCNALCKTVVFEHDAHIVAQGANCDDGLKFPKLSVVQGPGLVQPLVHSGRLPLGQGLT